MTMSAKFVYLGDEIWDLKERNLEFWDKENFGYVETEFENEEDEEDLDFSEFVLDEDMIKEPSDDEEEIAPEDIEEKEYIDMELPIKSTDDDEEDEPEIEFDDDEDEDRYNEVMDDYEDMYD